MSIPEREAPIEQLIDVGGYHLRLACAGRGRPVVVLIAGGMDPLEVWSAVQREIALSTQVCAFDRAGVGGSDTIAAPVTVGGIADALHTLLTRAGIAGPYVVVGHSLGGAAARLFADRAPHAVAGMVLLDPTALCVMEEAPVVATEAAELGVDAQRGMAELHAARHFPPVPLVVLSHDPAIGPNAEVMPDPSFEALWRRGQADYAALSPLGRQATISGADHYLHETAPAMVIETVLAVVKAVQRELDEREPV